MKYLLETPHTKEECLKELDGLLAKGPEVLDKFYWGCTKGDHTGYALIDAKNESDARNLVPEFLRRKAKVIELSKFTPEQIKSFH